MRPSLKRALLNLLESYNRSPQAYHFALILFCGIAAYANSFHAPFYFDDLPCIVENPVVHNLSNLAHLDEFWQLGITEDIRNNIVTRFVVYLTFALNYKLHGLAVGGYHLVNLCIHLLNALLVYQLVRMMRKIASGMYDDRCDECRDLLPLIVALLFVSHPVMTNAVTYIVQRFASLATCFVLLTLYSYTRSILAPTRSQQRLFYGSALFTTILAMYTKEIAFTLPALLALFDCGLLSGDRRQRLLRLAPFFVTMLILPLTVMSLSTLSDVTGQDAANALDLANIGGGSRWNYFLTQWRVIVTYLRILILPAGLHLEYDIPLSRSLLDPAVLACGLFLTVLFATGLRLFLSRRGGRDRGDLRLIGFGILWFFVTLAMESTIIPLDDLLFEYRLYLPAFGFFLAATLGIDLLRRRLSRSVPGINTVTTVAAAAVILALTSATILRNHLWQDPLTFWQDNIARSPNRARPRCNLADLYIKQGDLPRAISELEAAGRINPNYWVPFDMLGNLRWNLGLYPQAARDYEEAVRRGNRSRNQLFKLGRARRLSGNAKGARESFSAILAMNPEDAETLRELRTLQR